MVVRLSGLHDWPRDPAMPIGSIIDVKAVAALDDRAKEPALGVADRAPSFAHALRDAVLGDRHVGPNGVEKLVARQDTAGIAG